MSELEKLGFKFKVCEDIKEDELYIYVPKKYPDKDTLIHVVNIGEC